MLQKIPSISLRILAEKGKGHEPVKVVEERQQVEPELEEALRLVPRKRAEDLRCIVHVVLVPYPKRIYQRLGHIGRKRV